MKPLIRFLIKHLSIKSRLVLMFLVPGVIYYLFSTALSFSHIQSLSSAKVTELQAVIESAIGKTSGQFLSRGLTDDLENVLTSLVDNTAVSGAIVFDVDSSIFAQAGDLNLTGDIKAFEHPIYHQTIVPDFEGIDFNDGVSKSNPVQIGVLQFYVDIESTMDQSWKAAIGDSLMLLITILICSPFFFALYQSFHIPLSSILDNILKFEQGKYDWIEAQSGDDEFSRVKQALVRVANTVNEQTKQISEANSALELRAFELERQIGFATEAREEADKATTQKDIFVANVTHEMRHPLVGVVSGVDLMEQFILCAQNRLMELNREATPEQHILLKSIRADLKDAINGLSISKKCSKELTLMVDELLASIQDMYHEITLHPSTFILYDSLIVLLKSHADQALVKGLDYKFDINGLTADSQTYVKGDWVRLSQVVNSLIDNAIRFTDQGCVDIVIDIVSKDNGVKLLIAVSDSGVGISSHEQESIFKLFHIGEDPTHKKHAGLGTGLTIAQKIANRMKGELNLDCSTIGEGSRFSFNITLPLSKAANMLPEYSDSLPICQKRISLLYVEDSRLNRQVFQMYCELSNIDLILAKDGIEGFEKYNSHRFDALIVDCFMPVMNGFELVEKIRQKELNEDSDHIAIFALTADASTRNRERCFEAGYDEFLTKPYTNASFRFILDRIKRINLKYQRS